MVLSVTGNLTAVLHFVHLQLSVAAHSHKMKLFAAGCIFIAYLVLVSVSGQQGCLFSVHGQGEKNSPILLQNDTSLLLPTNGRISLRRRDAVTLLCPDTRNYITRTHSNISQAQCVQNNILRIANQDIPFSEIECKKVIRGSVLKTSKPCGGSRGRISKIGYPLSSKQFIPLIHICYDEDLGSTLYSMHLLHGQEIKHASKTNYRPSFSPDGLPSSVSASVAYKQAFQKSTFSRLLKSSALAANYIDHNSFLARGHLSPDADFLFAAWQFTTYYFLNTCPQWQIINAGNWNKVEHQVRRVAAALKETLEVFTGTHGVLELPDFEGRPREVFLVSGEKLPVPKFIWKAVYSKKSREAIVLVSLNNPFALETEREVLCKSVCETAGWGDASWNDYQRGLVHCCDYREFARAVETAPKLSAVGVLHGLK